MTEEFLRLLVDPATGADLSLTIAERKHGRIWTGSLNSPAASYPIVRGVPRFVRGPDDASAASFSGQWNRWSRTQFESENTGKPMEGHTRRMWRAVTGIEGSLGGATVADFGCGSGRFIEVARAHGARVIALDLSEGADIAGEIFRSDPDVLVCQGSILESPLRSASVDGAYSIGVFHHTPEPRQAALNMFSAVRQGGWAALSVYGNNTHYARWNVELFRRFFRATWPIFGPRLALLYTECAVRRVQPFFNVPLVGLALKGVFPSIRLPDPEWSRLDTFDSVTPKYQSTHTLDEVFEWARTGGISEPLRANWGSAACRGTKN